MAQMYQALFFFDESNPTNTNFQKFPQRVRKNDNAHPPIHPTKAVELDDIAKLPNGQCTNL